VKGSPEPPSPYITTPLFSHLKFQEPVEMISAPASDRLFVLELSGKVYSFQTNSTDGKPELFLDVKHLDSKSAQVFGLVFHPKFPANPKVYVCYILGGDLADGSRVSELKVELNGKLRAIPESEKILLTFRGGGHNAGCLRFGPDGFLYIATGDAAAPDPPDGFNTGQDVSDLLSSILRIDVNAQQSGKAYRIPEDNPFVNLAGARPEIFAFGFRNPWKMSFDKVRGDLWVGDVGWELWEMIFRVQKGGNYGWSIMEGPHKVRESGKKGPGPILPPAISHSHSEAASITGGYVYRGKLLKELIGAYIYGDWETGKIWALRHDGSRIISVTELYDAPYKIISFGEDNYGELYILDFAGSIYGLIPNPVAGKKSEFPTRISETGLFKISGAGEPLPMPGVYPYEVSAELWTDGATAQRFIALPENSALALSNGNWWFPSNAVLARTVGFTNQSGKLSRRIETQLLHFDGQGWNGYSYEWQANQQDAILVDKNGRDAEISIPGRDVQAWRFHSRAECLRCHNPWAGNVLGFNEPQLKGVSLSGTKNEKQGQWKQLERLGLLPDLTNSVAKSVLSKPSDRSLTTADRARSYLHANCAHCHREHAGGSVLSYLNFDMPLEKAGLLRAVPMRGQFGIPEASVVTPGDPFSSLLYYRIVKSGTGHMPYLGSKHVDPLGAELVYEWIASMSSALGKREMAPAISSGFSADTVGTMLNTVRGAMQLSRMISTKQIDPAGVDEIARKGYASSNPAVRDLFKAFVPPDQRIEVLGAEFLPGQVLSHAGDSERGRAIFFQEGGVQCYSCHRVQNEGYDFGPDLSRIGAKFQAPDLLEHVRNPEKIVDATFATHRIETVDETVYTGFLVSESATEWVLRTVNSPTVRIPKSQVAKHEKQSGSLMPGQLLQNLTAQEAADLVAFLGSLK